MDGEGAGAQSGGRAEVRPSPDDWCAERDHVVVIGERHLKGILSEYVDYYNGIRTHLSLAKDAPEPRSVQPPSQGSVVGGATRGWAPSRIPPESGVSPSDE